MKHLATLTAAAAAAAALSLAPTAGLDAACVYDQGLEGQNLQVGTMLSWSTAYEEDNAIFIVEKSEDGANFGNIGTIEGAGTTDDLREYNFLDIMATAEQSFYRLKQVDTDGSFSYSEVVSVPQVYTNNFMVARMSNVATQDVFELTIDSMVDADMSYSLSNLRGEEVYADEVMLAAGLNDLAVDLSSHEEGIYKLAMTVADETETLVIKRVTDEIARKPNVASAREAVRGRN